jgi:hypothetical protein
MPRVATLSVQVLRKGSPLIKQVVSLDTVQIVRWSGGGMRPGSEDEGEGE